MNNYKRERSANFTMQERDILVSLIVKYKAALENKENGSLAWKKKEAAWRSIEKEFNARSRDTFRSIKTLKIKYEGLKRTVRKKSAILHSQLYPSDSSKIEAAQLDRAEEKIKTIISVSPDVIVKQENLDDMHDTPIVDSSMVDVEIKENFNQNEVSRLQFENTIAPTNDSYAYPANNTEIEHNNLLEDDVNDHETFHVPDDDYVTQRNSTQNNLSRQWDVNSRRNFKSRKYFALMAQKRHVDELRQAKLDLINLQRSYLEAEIIEKRKEWEFNEKERQWKEQEYKLKLEKLKKELNG